MAMGDAIGGLIIALLVLLPFGALGIWKLVEIIIWLINNVSITVGVWQ
jgi:uncharacterized membrane protein